MTWSETAILGPMTRIVQFLIRVNSTEPRPDSTLVDDLNMVSKTLNRSANADSTGVFVAVPGATVGTAHADLMAEAPFDAIVELRGDDVSIQAAMNELNQALSVDHGSSAVLSGVEHEFVGGEDAYRLQVFVAASPLLSHNEFIDHWLNRHGNLIRPTRTGPPYKQFHADVTASDAAASLTGSGIRHFAGAAIAGYPDLGSYRRALSNRERMAPIIEDELRFIDHAHSVVGFYRAI